MKKIVAIAFIGGLVLASCAKKETATESNIMLQEPEVKVTDSAKVDSATPAKMPTAVAKDSATAK